MEGLWSPDLGSFVAVIAGRVSDGAGGYLNRFVELGGDRKDAARIRRKIAELENPSKDESSGL